MINGTVITPQTYNGSSSVSSPGTGGGLSNDELLARVAMRLFANEDMQAAIAASLIDLGHHSDAEAVCSLLFTQDGVMIDRVHAWRRDGRHSPVIPFEGKQSPNCDNKEPKATPDCRSLDIGGLPAETRQELSDLRITSEGMLITVPIKVERQPTGVLLIQHATDKHCSAPAYRVVLDAFGHLLERAVYLEQDREDIIG